MADSPSNPPIRERIRNYLAAHSGQSASAAEMADVVPVPAAPPSPAAALPIARPAGEVARAPTVSPPTAAETAVKAHLRKPPQPPTLEFLLDQFRLFESRPLSLGKSCALWLNHQPELPIESQLPRGEALRRIREGLVKQDQATYATRLDRFIAAYFVALELGWEEAWRVRYSCVRELLPLFGRNAATEEYQLRPERADATRALWRRIVDQRLTASAVREQVGKIMPRKTVRMHGRSGRLAVIRRDVQRLKAKEDLLEVLRLVQDRLERLGSSAEPVVA